MFSSFHLIEVFTYVHNIKTIDMSNNRIHWSWHNNVDTQSYGNIFIFYCLSRFFGCLPRMTRGKYLYLLSQWGNTQKLNMCLYVSCSWEKSNNVDADYWFMNWQDRRVCSDFESWISCSNLVCGLHFLSVAGMKRTTYNQVKILKLSDKRFSYSELVPNKIYMQKQHQFISHASSTLK